MLLSVENITVRLLRSSTISAHANRVQASNTHTRSPPLGPHDPLLR